jgi:hypothetical protein
MRQNTKNFRFSRWVNIAKIDLHRSNRQKNILILFISDFHVEIVKKNIPS